MITSSTLSTPRRLWATLGRILIIVGVAVIAVVVVSWAVGVQVELDGGNLPRLAMYNAEAHFTALETDRAAQPVVPMPTTAPAIDRRPEALWPAYRGITASGPTGRATGCRACGTSRSAAATPRSWPPTTGCSPSNSGATVRW